MTELYRVYWDACAWIALINQEPVNHNNLRKVYEAAQHGEIEIWTSAFTYAEVFKKNCGVVPVGTHSMMEDKIDAMDDILSQEFIKRVNVDSIIGMQARKLLQEHPEIKKPQDGIHVATALYHNLDALHTFDKSDLIPFDDRLLRRDGKKLRIHPPQDDIDGPLFAGKNKTDNPEE